MVIFARFLAVALLVVLGVSSCGDDSDRCASGPLPGAGPTYKPQPRTTYRPRPPSSRPHDWRRQPTNRKTTVYVPAPSRRDDGYRQYPGYPGWYAPGYYPYGYGERYHCNTGHEGEPVQ